MPIIRNNGIPITIHDTSMNNSINATIPNVMQMNNRPNNVIIHAPVCINPCNI